MEKFVKCPECGRLLNSNTKHCGYCGAFDIKAKGALEETSAEIKPEYICYDCGEWVNSEATYCKKCGGTVGKASERPDVAPSDVNVPVSDSGNNTFGYIKAPEHTFVGTDEIDASVGKSRRSVTYGETAVKTGGKKTFKPAGDL